MSTHPRRLTGAAIGAIALIAVALPHTSAIAQETADSPWRVDLTSWIWLMGIDGNVGVGPVTTDVSADIFDVIDTADSLFAFSGRLEVGYGPIAGFVDGIYAKIGADDTSGPVGLTNIDLTLELGVVDFGAMYRLYDGPGLEVAQAAGRNATLDVYAGARYIDLDVELDPANAVTRRGGDDWIDPIIGLKLQHPLAEQWDLAVWGDVGGFGANSDLTWSVTGVVGYRFKLFDMPATLYTGYRAIGWDYEEGSGPDRLDWDVVLHGPTLGITVSF